MERILQRNKTFVFTRDAPKFRPPKIFGRKWPKSAFSAFGRNTFITETTRPKQEIVMTQTKTATSTRLSGRLRLCANMSAVWEYFHISENYPRIAICKTCNSGISRGGKSTKSFSTSGLIFHLKSKHPDRHSDFEKNTAQKRKINPSAPAPSVADLFEKARQFSSDSAKAKGITQKMMEFIALDDQPFSVVDDVGFRRLIKHIEPRYAMPSRRHFSDVCLPELYNVVANHVHELIAFLI